MKLRTLLPLAALAAAWVAPSWPVELTYPVDVVTTRWALRENATGKLVRDNIKWPHREGIAYPVPGHTWLLRVVGERPAVDPRIYNVVESKTQAPAANELRITYQAKWRTRAEIEAALDASVTQHSLICAQGRDIHSACAAAAALAQQTADGDTTASTAERARARLCSAWAKACVRPNEANGVRLLTELRAAFSTRNDPTPAPVPDLDGGWTDAPAAP